MGHSEQEYAVNGEGCYILDAQTEDGWICVDAICCYSSIGRLLHHASKTLPTLTPYKPFLVGGKWRVGFVASRDIEAREELTWDYGCPPGGVESLMTRRKNDNSAVESTALKSCQLHRLVEV